MCVGLCVCVCVCVCVYIYAYNYIVSGAGYTIQWPYMQTKDGKEVTFVPALKTGQSLLPPQQKCQRKVGGKNGWVWDYSLMQLRNEYWDCGPLHDMEWSEETRKKKDTFIFLEGDTAFHFDSQFYKVPLSRARSISLSLSLSLS